MGAARHVERNREATPSGRAGVLDTHRSPEVRTVICVFGHLGRACASEWFWIGCDRRLFGRATASRAEEHSQDCCGDREMGCRNWLDHEKPFRRRFLPSSATNMPDIRSFTLRSTLQFAIVQYRMSARQL